MTQEDYITVKTACGICADFVPESEDDRMREAVLWCIETVEGELCCKDANGISIEQLKVWLEKKYNTK